jgi:hypothetical protein
MRPFERSPRVKSGAQQAPEAQPFRPREFPSQDSRPRTVVRSDGGEVPAGFPAGPIGILDGQSRGRLQQHHGPVRPAAQLRLPIHHPVQGQRVQAKLAVQVGLEAMDIEDDDGGELETTHKDLRISTVHIADRPPGLFTPDEKSHTTAWAVYTDQVRNAILGRPVRDAAQAIRNLYADAQNLPGVARAGNLSGAAKAAYDRAKKIMDGLKAIDLGTLPEERHVDMVQRLAKWFLAYRNAIPLSQIDIGRATGHGEPEVLKLLRPANDLREGWEQIPDDDGMRLKEGVAARVRASMWSLLDAPALQSLDVLTPDPTKAPGVNDEDGGPPRRLAEVIVQHLWTLEATYETVFREAAMDSKESIEGYLTSIGYKGSYGALIYKKIAEIYEGGTDKAAQENPERYRTAGPAGQGDFSVQVFTGKDSTINELFIGGRAPTLLGSSQGSHSTAWITYVDAVRNQVVGRTVENAVKGILELFGEADALPGMKRVGNLDEKQAYWFTLANNERKAALAHVESLTSKLQIIPALQRLIRAYLGFRNAVPLSQIKGGLADGNAEAHYRAQLRYLESDFTSWTGVGAAPVKDPNVYLKAFWELYDYTAMGKAVRHEVEPPDAPGITNKEHPFGIAAASVHQHLLTMRRSYPKTFATVKAASPESLGYVLGKMNIHPSQHEDIIKLMK